MRRRLLVVGVLLVGLAALAGCDLIDGIIDSLTGGGSGSGGGGFGAVVSGRMEFHLAAYITKSEGYSEPGTVGTTFMSSGGSYNAATKTFTATWDRGDFSNTSFEARLNSTEEYIEYFYARQTQSGVWGAWTYVHEIRGYNVLYSHTEGTSRFFVVDGSDAHVIVDQFVYKAWSNALGSAQDPVEWVSVPGALTGDTGDIITIRLDY
jgi:hypothetical protein